ncbi:MAG: response regulator [Ktedonobacterales bacterium]
MDFPLTPTERTTHAFVVEADGAIRALLVTLLELEGYQVDQAATGRAALQYLHASPESVVVVLDWELSDLSGAEVLSDLRADTTAMCRHAVVTVSGYLLDSTILSEQFSAPLSIACVRKPFHIHEMLTAVRRAAAGLPQRCVYPPIMDDQQAAG